MFTFYKEIQELHQEIWQFVLRVEGYRAVQSHKLPDSSTFLLFHAPQPDENESAK